MTRKQNYRDDDEDRDLKDYINEAQLVLSKEIEFYTETAVEINSFNLLPVERSKLSKILLSITSYCSIFIKNLKSGKVTQTNFTNYSKTKESFDDLLSETVSFYEDKLELCKHRLAVLRDKEISKDDAIHLCKTLKIPDLHFTSLDKIEFEDLSNYALETLKEIINFLNYINTSLENFNETYVFPEALLEQLIYEPATVKLRDLIKERGEQGWDYTKDTAQNLFESSTSKISDYSSDFLDRNGLGFVRDMGLTKLPSFLLKSALSSGKKLFKRGKGKDEIDTSDFSDGFIKKRIEHKRAPLIEDNNDAGKDIDDDNSNDDNSVVSASKVKNSFSLPDSLKSSNNVTPAQTSLNKFLPSVLSSNSENDLIKALGENFSYLANSQTLVSSALKQQSNSIDNLSDTILTGMGSFKTESAGKNPEEESDGILSSVTSFFKGKGGKLKSIGGKIGTMLKSAGAFLISGTGLAASAAAVFGGTGLYSVYKGIKGEDASNWISNISDKIYQKVSGNKSGGIGTGIYNLLHDDEGNNRIGKLLTDTKDKILSVSATTANTAISKYKLIKEKAGDIWNNTKSLVSNTIKNPLDSVKAGFSNMFKFLSKIPGIGQFFEKVSPVKVDYLKTAKDFLKTIFQLLVSGIKSILPDKLGNMLLGGDSGDGSSEGIVQKGINWTKDKLGLGGGDDNAKSSSPPTTSINLKNATGGNVSNTVNNTNATSSTVNNSSISSDSEGIASVTPKLSSGNSNSVKSSAKPSERFNVPKLSPVAAPTESKINNYSNVSTMLNSNYEDISDIGIKMLAGSFLT